MKIYEYDNIKYKEAILTPLSDLDQGLQVKFATLGEKVKDDGACVYNAALTANETACECVEGFVICMGAGYPGAIRHCWNKIGETFFDLTKEFVWARTRPAASFYYFPLAVFGPDTYLKDYNFRSNAVELAAAVNTAVNNEAKAMESFNYINFLTED